MHKTPTWPCLAAIVGGIKSRIIPITVVDAADKVAFAVGVAVAVAFALDALVGHGAAGIVPITYFCNIGCF